MPYETKLLEASSCTLGIIAFNLDRSLLLVEWRPYSGSRGALRPIIHLVTLLGEANVPLSIVGLAAEAS